MNDVYRQVGDLTTFTPGNETAAAQKDAEIERLRKRLSGALQHLEEAREGLANYAQELAQLRDLSLTWAMVCDCNCQMCQVLFKRIRDAEPQPGEHDAQNIR